MLRFSMKLCGRQGYGAVRRVVLEQVLLVSFISSLWTTLPYLTLPHLTYLTYARSLASFIYRKIT